MGFGLLKGKIAVVTGGSRGIGRQIVLRFAEEGAHVVFNYTSHDKKADETVDKALAFGTVVKAEKVSVTDFKGMSGMIERVNAEFSKIDVLVNNAGITRDGMLAMMKEANWDEVINVNLKAMFMLCKLVIKGMMSRKTGRIINLSSISGIIGREGQANYAASKGGIISFTKSIAREVGKYGVTANAVVPGLIETSMTKRIPRKVLKELTAAIPAGRLGTPEEVANAIVFLASDLSSFVNGDVLNVNGGQV